MVGKDSQVVEWTLAPTGLNFAMGSSQKSRFAPLEAADSMVPPWLGSIWISGLWPTLGSPSTAAGISGIVSGSQGLGEELPLADRIFLAFRRAQNTTRSTRVEAPNRGALAGS